MKRFLILAATLVLTLGLVVFAGAAAAGNGNGNDHGNGKGNGSANGAAASTDASQSAAPGKSGSAPGHEKKSGSTQSTQQQSSTDTGQASVHGNASVHSSSSSTQAGVKPSNSTDHWTKCGPVGGSGAGTTCARVSPPNSSLNGVQDTSKRYGNGQTAAQIASSRGASAAGNVQLTGPGNSQPHKVTVCGKPSNRSGGVDVHAVKSYDQTSCQQSETQTQQQVQVQAPCGFSAVTTSSVVGMEHVNGQGVAVHLMTNTHSAHFSKHGNDIPMTTSATVLVPNGQSCNTSVVQQTPGTSNQTPGATLGTSGAATPGTTPVAVSASGTGGVLGAQASLASHGSAGAHGVLGTAAHVAGTTLPFTGFPLWAAVLAAAALIAAGAFFRRHGRADAHA